MEIISFKLEESMLSKMDKLLKHLHFSTRTEFIREAIREKLYKIETEKFVKKLAQFKGSIKTHVSDEKLREIREKVFLDLAKEYNIDLK